MLPFGSIKRRLRLVDRLLAAFTLLLPGGLFPCLITFAARLLPSVGESRLPLRGLVCGLGRTLMRFPAFRRAGSFRSFSAPAQIGGQFGMFAEGSVGADGAPEETTPGFFMVAAMMFRSSLSFAAPWWKRLLSAPQASSAAFIDGAAIA